MLNEDFYFPSTTESLWVHAGLLTGQVLDRDFFKQYLFRILKIATLPETCVPDAGFNSMLDVKPK